MITKTCRYCKFRGVDKTCTSEKFIYNSYRFDLKEHPSDALSYFDGEAYSASFNTGDDFGCIHWEPHELVKEMVR